MAAGCEGYRPLITGGTKKKLACRLRFQASQVDHGIHVPNTPWTPGWRRDFYLLLTFRIGLDIVVAQQYLSRSAIQ